MGQLATSRRDANMASDNHTFAPGHGKPPVAIFCVGMAGSGKTTFMQRINAHLHQKHTESPTTNAPPYVLNLDPAVRSVPFESNIDIRDSVNYKEVMKQYNLGPNGGILTSLNLFSTKIDQVMGILEKRCLPKDKSPEAPIPTPASDAPRPAHILIDTPGQIEVFVWSASGSILLSSLASSFPTVVAYVIDTPRTLENTSTFMSNMLYAISILYKTKLPMILVFNKTDVKDESQAVEWMRDFDSFQEALREEEESAMREGGIHGGGGYMGSLLNSMSLVLEEFYKHLSVVGVSSMTGAGIDQFFSAVEGKKQEFETDYKPEMEKRRKEALAMRQKAQETNVNKMMKDMRVSSGRNQEKGYPPGREPPETVSDAEDMDAEETSLGGLVDCDDDDDEVRDEHPAKDFEDGLKARYEKALRDSGNAQASSSSLGLVENYVKGKQG